MKNNKGITLVALVVTIITISILIGITVSSGGGLLQKSKMTDYIGYMKLVKARADVEIEDKMFDGVTIPKVCKTFSEENVASEIAEKSYHFSRYETIKWGKDEIKQQGIDNEILDTSEYFVIVFDTTTMKTVDVIYSTGCGYDGERYYSLSDMENVINGPISNDTEIVTRKIENQAKNAGFDGTGWKVDGGNRRYDSTKMKSGTHSLKLTGVYGNYNAETVCESSEIYEFVPGHKYYISIYADWNGTGKGGGINYFYEYAGGGINLDPANINVGIWEKQSTLITMPNYTARVYNRVDNDNGYNNANTVWVDELFICDVTTTFAGIPEPDGGWKAWCDANLEYGVTEVVVPTN